MQWFGHIEITEEHLVKMITRTDVRGISPGERPQKGWINCVKQALNAKEMLVEQRRVIVHDRSVMNA